MWVPPNDLRFSCGR